MIKRAVELEAERSVLREKSSRQGLSLSELEKIAAESGIDPELIQRAAEEFEKGTAIPELDKREAASVKKDEIVCERWINVDPNVTLLDDMVTELNHCYGTSDKDVNWWDQFWDDYKGKAKVRKTSTSLEWHYTDEWGYYSTRVLFQNRGGKFRIRVSKRQLWDMEWSSENDYAWTLLLTLPLFAVIGGTLSFSLLETAWPGIAGGAIISFVSYPIIKYFSNRSLNKHKAQVTDTANDLAELALQLSNEDIGVYKQTKRTDKQERESIPIEITDHDENENPGGGRLRNSLREKR